MPLGKVLRFSESTGHPARVKKLRKELGVDRRTLQRWRRWWTEKVPRTIWWREVRGEIAGELVTDELPHSLFERFVGDGRGKLLGLLRLMGPLTQSERMSRRYSMVK